MSHSPGKSVLPCASITVAFAGMFTCARVPTCLIRPLSISTAESGIGSRPVPSINVAPTTARSPLLLPSKFLARPASTAMPSCAALATNTASAGSYPSRIASKWSNSASSVIAAINCFVESNHKVSLPPNQTGDAVTVERKFLSIQLLFHRVRAVRCSLPLAAASLISRASHV